MFIQYNGEYLLEQQNSDACFCKITCLVQSVLCKEPNRKHFNQSRHLPHHVIALNFGIPSRDHQMITKYWQKVIKKWLSIKKALLHLIFFWKFSKHQKSLANGKIKLSEKSCRHLNSLATPSKETQFQLSDGSRMIIL